MNGARFGNKRKGFREPVKLSFKKPRFPIGFQTGFVAFSAVVVFNRVRLAVLFPNERTCLNKIFKRRRIVVHVVKIDMYAYDGMVFFRLVRKPTKAVICRFVLRTFQRLVDLKKVGIFIIVPEILPADQIINFRYTLGDTVNLFYIFECFLEGELYITFIRYFFLGMCHTQFHNHTL